MAYIDCDKCYHGRVCAYRHHYHDMIVDCNHYVPTADVVEVVRCKDCKFNVANMEKDPLDTTDYSGDDIVCSYFMTDGLDPNDYCSQGKPQKEV